MAAVRELRRESLAEFAQSTEFRTLELLSDPEQFRPFFCRPPLATASAAPPACSNALYS